MSLTTTKQVLRIGVDGMDCAACEQLLVEYVQRIGGVSASFADAEKGTLALVAESDTPMDEITSAIVMAGFMPAGLDADAHHVVGRSLRPSESFPAPTPAPETPGESAAPETPGESPALLPAPALAGEAPTYRRLTLSAVGMHCVACEKLVSMTTHKVAGVVAAEGDTPTNTVTVYVQGDVSMDALARAIVAAGFTPGDPMVMADDRVTALPGAARPATIPSAAPAARRLPRPRGPRWLKQPLPARTPGRSRSAFWV